MFLLLPFFLLAQPKNEKEADLLIEQGIEKMYHKDHSASLEILVQAKSIAETKGWDQQNFRATNNIGANYSLMLDYGEALKYYLEAYEIAEKTGKAKNRMTVLNNIAILYFHELNNEKAYEFFLKAYKISKEENQADNQGFYALNLGFVLNKLKRLQEAEKFIDEARNLIPKDTDNYLMVDLAESENYLFQKNYRLAEELALQTLPQLKGKKQQENRTFVYLILVQIYEEQKDFDLAISYLEKARMELPKIHDRVEIFHYFSKIAALQRKYETSLLYKDSIILAKDSLNNLRNSSLYENGKIKFEIQNYQYELKESQRKLESSRNLFLTFLVSGILILLLLGLAFRNNHIKHKQREKIVELELEKKRNENLLMEKQYKEQEALTTLENERLQNELEKKNRKLATRALHLSSKNEVMEEMIQKLSSHPQTANSDFVKNYIRELKIQLKNDSQLDSFFTHFEEANPEFLSRLNEKHPNLIPGEIRFITYVYMNLNNKEIASLLNITPQSTRKRKERLAKKINLPEGESLYGYLSSI